MLDGIDDVDWAGLTHAYGSAEDLPDLLRQVAGPEADEAIEELYSTVVHQGTIYPATAAAVPFLVDLARHSRYSRADVLWLLGDVVDEGQPDGPRVRAALVREIPSLLTLLFDDAADVRTAVAYPLARAGAPAAPLIERWAVEKDSEVRASLALALGEVYVPAAGPALAAAAVHGPPEVRLAAAVALMRAGQDWPDGTIAALVDAIDADPELPDPWMPGGLERELLVPLAPVVAADLLPRMLRSARPGTRAAALDAIGVRCIERRSAPALFLPMAGPALHDEDPDVRRAALGAMRRGGAAAGEFADTLAGFLPEVGARDVNREESAALHTLMLLGDPRWVESACAATDRGMLVSTHLARFSTAALLAVREKLRAEPARADALADVLAQWGVHTAVPELVAGMPHGGLKVTRALLDLGHDEPAALPHLRTLVTRLGDLRAAAAIWRLTGDAEPMLGLLRTAWSGLDWVPPGGSVAFISDMGSALRPLLPEATALLAATPVRTTQLLAARVVAAAGELDAALPTVRAALAAGGWPGELAADLIADVASTHPELSSLEPLLRRGLNVAGIRLPAARALLRLGVPGAELAGPLVAGITDDYRIDVVAILLEIHAAEAIPALEELVNQDERLDATNVVPDLAWADELLRTRIEQAIETLRG